MNINEINEELKAIAEYNIEMANDIMYDEMVDELTAEFEMTEYAARSYDYDAVSYGMQ